VREKCKHASIAIEMFQLTTLRAHTVTVDIVGSFGDLGTFIPLFVAMGRGDGSARSIHVAPALFWAGLSNVATGCYWDLPLPVQPMKTICAVALVGELDRVQVSTAGVWMVRVRRT
jgi:hypothetical protein